MKTQITGLTKHGRMSKKIKNVTYIEDNEMLALHRWMWFITWNMKGTISNDLCDI